MQQIFIPAHFCSVCGAIEPDESTKHIKCCSQKTKRCQIRVFLSKADAKTWSGLIAQRKKL